ncbi:hypothetical protein ACKUSY_12745 [Myroides odoratus]
MGKRTKTSQERWAEYRNSVYLNKVKSEDDFEKYINVLSSGGLVLGLTVIDKALTKFEVIYLWVIILALVLLVITLLSNLVSHYISVFNADKIIGEIDNEEYNSVYEKSKSRNDIIHKCNIISISSLIIGCLGIIIFVTINLVNMNVEKQIPKIEDRTDYPQPDTGRTNIPPPPVKPKS